MDKLVRLISERVISALKPQEEIEKTISHKEAAAFLNIHEKTLSKWLREGVYPARIVHLNGRKKEYYKSELQDLVKNNRR